MAVINVAGKVKLQGGMIGTPGKYNNYVVGNTVLNSFIVGDFQEDINKSSFLIAVEPEDESPNPMITGNFLSSEGEFLFRIVKNILIVNPLNCKRIYAHDQMGYAIHDSKGNEIIKVSTKFEKVEPLKEECFITRIYCCLYDFKGNIIFQIREHDKTLESDCKFATNFNGNSFLIQQKLNEVDKILFAYAYNTKGEIFKILSGEHKNEIINIENTLIYNASIEKCNIEVSKGSFKSHGSVVMNECNFSFTDNAENIKFLVDKINGTSAKGFVGNNTVGRNDQCTCGSGKKFKKCCGVG